MLALQARELSQSFCLVAQEVGMSEADSGMVRDGLMPVGLRTR